MEHVFSGLHGQGPAFLRDKLTFVSHEQKFPVNYLLPNPMLKFLNNILLMGLLTIGLSCGITYQEISNTVVLLIL